MPLIYGDGVRKGEREGDCLSNSEIAATIEVATSKTRDLMYADGFDRVTADRIVHLQGYIAGLASRINL